jgi:hypothetical protein
MKKNIVIKSFLLSILTISNLMLTLSRNEVESMILSGKHTASELFNSIYSVNYWCCDESVSGGGSTLASTEVIRAELPKIIQIFKIRSLLDAPCGDFNWMKTLNLPIDHYFGVDIVQDLIANNKRQYENNRNSFYCLDLIVDELPQADLIFCRDCLAHLSLANALSVVKNFKASGAIYLLATTHIATMHNKNINAGETSPYNLQLPPFNFPKPLLVIEETSAENHSRCSRKSLGLWKLEDITIS